MSYSGGHAELDVQRRVFMRSRPTGVSAEAGLGEGAASPVRVRQCLSGCERRCFTKVLAAAGARNLKCLRTRATWYFARTQVLTATCIAGIAAVDAPIPTPGAGPPTGRTPSRRPLRGSTGSGPSIPRRSKSRTGSSGRRTTGSGVPGGSSRRRTGRARRDQLRDSATPLEIARSGSYESLTRPPEAFTRRRTAATLVPHTGGHRRGEGKAATAAGHPGHVTSVPGTPCRRTSTAEPRRSSGDTRPSRRCRRTRW